MANIATLAKWALPITGGAIVVTVQTPPDVARSNAAKWIKELTGTVPDWPPWVASSLTYVGVLLIITWLLIVTKDWQRRAGVWLGRNVFWRFRRRPLEASPPPSTGVTLEGASATLQGTATIIKPSPEAVLERLLHTCYVLASPHKMKSHGYIELTIVAYNASEKTLILGDIIGNARCTVKDEEGKQLKEKLPTPDFVRLAPKRQIAPYSEFVVGLNQAVSPRQAELILATTKTQTVTIDFEDLKLEFSPFQEPGPVARLKLWDGVGISVGRGLRSGRVNILRVQAAVATAAGVGTAEGKSG